MMRVLLLSMYYPPEIGSNARIVEGLGQQLTELGDEVTIVTGFPHYPDGIIQPDYRGKFLLRQQLNNGIRVIRSWLFAAPRERKWFRIANYLSFALSAIVGGLLAGRHDVIYVYSPPLFLGITAHVLSRLKRIPFVLNVQDIYPDIAIHHGVIRNKMLIRALEKLERWVYRKAAHITVISEGFGENLGSKGVAPGKITVISNWVETHLFTPRSKDNSFSQEFGLLGGRFVVMYAGNIGHSQGLETVVEAARLLRDESSILFVIVGDGVKRRETVDLAH